MEVKKRFALNKTTPMSALELAEQQEHEIRKLNEENKRFRYKLESIDDYYQEKIAKLNEEWKSEMNVMIKKY